MGKICPAAEWGMIHWSDSRPGALIIILDEAITAILIVLPYPQAAD